jgi:hypothetical protein
VEVQAGSEFEEMGARTLATIREANTSLSVAGALTPSRQPEERAYSTFARFGRSGGFGGSHPKAAADRPVRRPTFRTSLRRRRSRRGDLSSTQSPVSAEEEGTP